MSHRGISTTINGINDSGELVGLSYLNGSTTYSGYFDLGGNVTIFSLFGANFTNANGVNNAGDIVGSYSIQNGGIQNGFLDIGGNFTTIDDPLGVGGTVLSGAARNGTISGGIGRSQWRRVGGPLAGIGTDSTSASKSSLAA